MLLVLGLFIAITHWIQSFTINKESCVSGNINNEICENYQAGKLNI